MMKCHGSKTTLKKKNKTKIEQSKKHNFFSNLVLNKYIVKDIAVDNFKYVITSYYNEHIKKVQDFTLAIYWDVDDETIYKISVSNRIFYALDVYGYPTTINETACDFSKRIITNYLSHKFSP